MHYSLFDSIPDLKNIQTINKNQRLLYKNTKVIWFEFRLTLHEWTSIVTKGINRLFWNNYCLLFTINVYLRIVKRKYYFANFIFYAVLPVDEYINLVSPCKKLFWLGKKIFFFRQVYKLFSTMCKIFFCWVWKIGLVR